MMPDSLMHPAVIRRRRVHNTAQSVWVTSYVCEAGAEACARLKTFEERDGEQWVDTTIAQHREKQWTCPAPTKAK